MTSLRPVYFATRAGFFLLWSVSSPSWAMPRTKQRSICHLKRVMPYQRDPKRKAPLQLEKTARMSSTVLSSVDVAARTSSTSTTSSSVAPTASEKKLSASPHATHDYSSSESEIEECECAEKGTRILEVSGLVGLRGSVL